MTGKEDFPILGELPAKNIDTGMGLERMAVAPAGRGQPVRDRRGPPDPGPGGGADRQARTAPSSGHAAAESHPDDVRLRVIADHVRTALMLIGDGVTPSNEGRGYVLRRIMRRAIRAMRLLGWQEPALPELLPVARDCMAPSYPEVAERLRPDLAVRLRARRRRSCPRCGPGTTILDTAIAETKKAGGKTLSGDKAFQLHDTYGFPIDLTLEIAAEQGLAVDEDGLPAADGRAAHAGQGRRAGAQDRATPTCRRTGRCSTRAAPVEFTGYTEVARESTVRARAVRGGAEPLPAAAEGDTVELVLDATPFYAEGGGQQPDLGLITVGGGRVEVLDVQQPLPGLIVHRGRVHRRRGPRRRDRPTPRSTSPGAGRSPARTPRPTWCTRRCATSSASRRPRRVRSTRRAGCGSTSTPPRRCPPSVLHDVEQQVNEVLMSDLEVHAFVTSQDEARRIGAMALFGEKYGDEVRVVEVGDYARELCGGTHAARSGQLGLVKILHEASIGSGVRRVEALVGMDAFWHLAREHLLVSRLAELYRVPSRAGRRPGRADRGPAARRGEGAGEAARPAGAGRRRRARRARRATCAGWRYVGIEAPEGAGANDVRTLAQEIRGGSPADRPGGGRGGRPRRRQGVAGRRGQRRRAQGARPVGRRTWSRARCPAGAAATPTWPRAAACRRPRRRRCSPRWRRPVARSQ